jgi:predicted SAM-dependent methyltransferase
MQVILGAGNTCYNGWISTDQPLFNILNETDWKRYFNKKPPHKLLAEHVLEHLSPEENKKALMLAYKHLISGGSFRIAVPDANHENTVYLEAVKPGGWDAGADDHKTFWDVDLFTQIAESAGFKVIPLEFYDNQHIFHITDYTNDNGYIERSRKNKYVDVNVPDYTSLIMDLIK